MEDGDKKEKETHTNNSCKRHDKEETTINNRAVTKSNNEEKESNRIQHPLKKEEEENASGVVVHVERKSEESTSIAIIQPEPILQTDSSSSSSSNNNNHCTFKSKENRALRKKVPFVTFPEDRESQEQEEEKQQDELELAAAAAAAFETESAPEPDSPIGIAKEEAVQWNDSDLLLALSALTTKDEIEEADSIPSIDIDPIELFQDDPNFQTIFDQEDDNSFHGVDLDLDLHELSSQFLSSLAINTTQDNNSTNNRQENTNNTLNTPTTEHKLIPPKTHNYDQPSDSELYQLPYCLPCDTTTSEDNLNQFLQHVNTLQLDELLEHTIFDTIDQETKMGDSTIVPLPSPNEMMDQSKSKNTAKKANKETNAIQLEPSSSTIEPFILESLKNKRKCEKTCYGHKETIFGVAFSPSGKYVATASQDSTIGIWNVETHALVSQLQGHSKDYECLRVAWSSDTKLASAGADGCVKIWEQQNDENDKKWVVRATLNHCKSQNDDGKPSQNAGTAQESDKKSDGNPDGEAEFSDNEENESANVPQIYALQFIEKWHISDSFNSENLLMTSSDDYIHLWSVNGYEKIMDINFTDLDMGFGGVFVQFLSAQYANSTSVDYGKNREEKRHLLSPNHTSSTNKPFGGHRNPENLVFVFDASYCTGNRLLGVALSDGTLRLLNGRGICVAILQLPGCQSHLTSFGWDTNGERLATCVATGHLVLWEIKVNNSHDVQPNCVAVLQGGHVLGRPLYGVKYCGNNDELIISWGVDGQLCLWDSDSEGQVQESLGVLVSRPEYPLYSADYTNEINCHQDKASKEDNNKGDKGKPISRIVIAGGREASFLGVPFYIYDILNNDSIDSSIRGANVES